MWERGFESNYIFIGNIKMCQLNYKNIKINDDMKKKGWIISYEIYYGVTLKAMYIIIVIT